MITPNAVAATAAAASQIAAILNNTEVNTGSPKNGTLHVRLAVL
jgi:hypothetical protein